MDDGHIAAVKGGGVLCPQLCHRPLHHVHGQLAGGVHAGAAVGLCAAGADLGAVAHVGAGIDHVPGHRVHRQAALVAQQLYSLGQHGVNGRQIQHIGDDNEVAILLHGAGLGRHVQLVARRSHALGQGARHLGQRGELAEFNGLAAILGDGTFLAKLIVYQPGAGFVDQGHVIKRLHFGAQRVAAGRQGGGLRCKQLQLHQHHNHLFHG